MSKREQNLKKALEPVHGPAAFKYLSAFYTLGNADFYSFSICPKTFTLIFFKELVLLKDCGGLLSEETKNERI
jgi:hypothetical protein